MHKRRLKQFRRITLATLFWLKPVLRISVIKFI